MADPERMTAFDPLLWDAAGKALTVPALRSGRRRRRPRP